MAVIHDDPEGGYVALIPSLPGCVTEGETIDDAYRYLADALDGWMQVAIEFNLNIPEPDDLYII